MRFKGEMFSKYIKGQLEIRNEQSDSTLRGEIESIVVTRRRIIVKFAWLAREVAPGRWVKEDKSEYVIVTRFCSVRDVNGFGWVCFHWIVILETAIFHLPDGIKLKPTDVEGLQLAAA